MAFLFKQLKIKSKQISQFDSLAVGFNVAREVIRINLHDHYVELTTEDIEFLVKQLPLAQLRLKEAMLKASHSKG